MKVLHCSKHRNSFYSVDSCPLCSEEASEWARIKLVSNYREELKDICDNELERLSVFWRKE